VSVHALYACLYVLVQTVSSSARLVCLCNLSYTCHYTGHQPNVLVHTSIDLADKHATKHDICQLKFEN